MVVSFLSKKIVTMFLVLDYQPEPELLCRAKFFFAEAALVLGLLVGLLFTLAAYFSQRVRQSGQEVEEVHRGLECEVAERKCVEEKLTLYRKIISNSSEAIAIIDPQGYYIEQNSAHYALLGYSDDELRGKTPAIYLGNEVFLAVTQKLEKGSYRGEVLSRTKQGVLLNLEISAFVLRNDAGEPIGAVGITRDITKRKQTEEVLRRNEQIAQAQVEELERLNRLKDEFLSTVSHELRTPITNIKMCISMLEAYLNREDALFFKNTKPNADHSKVAHYIRVLKDECQREISLINDLLDLQQLEAGFQPLVLETIELQTWLWQQVKPFQERAANRGQILQLNITPEMPPLISELSSIERILAELLNNSCKYTPPGEHITVTARAESGMILLSVSNSGIEIPADQLHHIFERFYRIPQADRWKQGGTGLGLALVRKLVERLGGSIQVKSTQASTCFTVKLPQVHY